MAKNILSIALLLILFVSCKNYEDHRLKVEKIRESVNAVKFSVSLTGDDIIQCFCSVKYNDIILHQFELESHRKETPSGFIINYSEFPIIAQSLAADFVLNRNPQIEIVVQNKENKFYRESTIDLNPSVPPVMTGIEVISDDITRKYPISLTREIYEIDSYLMENNIGANSYTLERVATVSLLIKNNSKILLTVVPVGDKVPVYKGRKYIDVTVQMDSESHDPFLAIFPSRANKYYDGPTLYEIAYAHYTDEKEDPGTVASNGKFEIKKRFDVNNIIGEYDLFLIINEGDENYFYYNLGSAIFDNVAPEFNELILGNYYFRGDDSYEGKVYLDYSIPFTRNPYDVIFSGKVFGDVKDLAVDGTRVDINGKSDIVFTKKIYIPDGYKNVNVKITDAVGNLKNYTIPLIVSH